MNNLKKIRVQKNKTISQLAAAVGVSDRHISFIEKGDRNPSVDIALKIASVLDVGVEDIFLPCECTKSTNSR
jgi:Predicted transcriptional regulators